MNIPEGYNTVMPYLILNGAHKFLKFAETVFAAIEREEYKSMREGTTIRHSEIVIGDSTIMFADSTPEFAPSTSGLFIYVNDADKTYKKALQEGAKSIMEPADQQYGRSCGVEDPWGNIWWITSII